MTISAFTSYSPLKPKPPLPTPTEESRTEQKPSPTLLIKGIDQTHFIALAILLNRSPEEPIVQGLGFKLYTILNSPRADQSKLGSVHLIHAAPSRSNPRNLIPLKVRFTPTQPPRIYVTRSDNIKGAYKNFSIGIGFPSCHPLALLSMPKGTKSDPENWSRGTLQEWNAAIKFGDHPSVARCFDLYLYASSKTRKPRVGMVVERLNCDLKTLFPIENDKTLLRILRSSVKSLHELHKSGLIHRDLKPDNIGVYLKSSEVRLLDLGFLCATGEPTRVCGSLGYVAPEILAYGLLLTDPPPPSLPSQDVWSLGVLIFVFTGPGKTPLFQEALVENFKKKRETDLKILSDLVETELSERIDLSLEMKELLRGMLQIDPLKRFSMQLALDLINHPDFCIRPKPLPLPPEDSLLK